jgi:hypothetical protein
MLQSARFSLLLNRDAKPLSSLPSIHPTQQHMLASELRARAAKTIARNKNICRQIFYLLGSAKREESFA